MTLEELESAIVEVKERTDKPFGVNLRADAGDAGKRVDLRIEDGVQGAGRSPWPPDRADRPSRRTASS